MQEFGDVTIQRVIDAREQILVLCLVALRNPWPPPTIPTRACAFLTNDVVRLIGERWVLTPVRRFIVHSHSTGLSARTAVVSLGSTAGVVGVDVDCTGGGGGGGLLCDHSVMCWLGRDKLMLLDPCYNDDPYANPHEHLKVLDAAHVGSLVPKVQCLESPDGYGPKRIWGNHKWAIAQCSRGTLYLHKVEEVLAKDDDDAGGHSASRRSSAWVCIDAGGHGADGDDDVDVDVVFSHTVPGDAIGEGDEASVLVCLGKNARKTITVDLAESFSRGSLVAVTEGTECATSQWARWHPFLFMDGIGNQVLVQEEFESGACVFAVNITTGQRTKLRYDCASVLKVDNQLVKLDTTTYNVFTGQICTLVPSDGMPQTILDRGLVVVPASSGTLFYRAVIDTHTGSTLCRLIGPSTLMSFL